MNRIAKFLALRFSDKLLLIKAVLFLGIFRLALLTLKFPLLARWLGRPSTESVDPDPQNRAALQVVGWAVRTAAGLVPWEANCLPQAITAKFLLRSRGVGSTLYLGLRQDDALRAHAWLKVGSVFVVGEDGAARHSVVATFT